jgi:hypothetical protein
MDPTRLFAIISVISLPTVMFGGLSLRRMLETSPGLTEFQRTYFRAGHAHAGVLIVLSLIYMDFFDRTTASDSLKWVAYIILLVGILAQSGGFFLHMVKGEPNRPSVGTMVSTLGALLLTVAMLILVYALIAEWP